jgi:hypothetical protein
MPFGILSDCGPFAKTAPFLRLVSVLIRTFGFAFFAFSFFLLFAL